MPDTATLSARFQISIPKAVREAQRWRPAKDFVFIPKEKGVLVMPVRRHGDLRGLAEGANPDDYRDRSDRL